MTEVAAPHEPAGARRPHLRRAHAVPTWAAKTVLAVTGLIFTSFVVVHMIGNLKVFGGAAGFDGYAEWLRTLLYPLVPHEGVLWGLRVVLVLSLVAHIGCSVLLVRRSRAAAGPRRRRAGLTPTSFGARTMMLTGVVLLLFVVFHVLDMTTGTPPAASDSFVPGSPYANLVASFARPWVAAFYGITMALLAVHVAHGVRTAAGDLGVTGVRSRAAVTVVGGVAAVAVLVGNAMIPIAVQAGWLS
ncbi:succinate dehydrogenase [Dietzia sp. JS16-p6b]|uniref:succinate dehydrogenase n=1 Tax=Dietzia sp. DQ11-38-2 TaxID=2711155 RepID=UPI000D207BAF|nr:MULTISPECIES: succinate dehydrogenase [unclassified Dietzia]AVZ39623.1 succinate dehydrogenase [Dietzia sp. JS16-p6b]MBB1027542.1 succinate dehydrogenase [Dietzia sp. DQ11-38-2]QGW24930.1 succinate dehydrogenase cytochrome b subunit [Dietzia sp. DQ12-45-1b]